MATRTRNGSQDGPTSEVSIMQLLSLQEISNRILMGVAGWRHQENSNYFYRASQNGKA
jgi:hypothetical protein